ncbi:unnamed protein product [Urochloa humidicola]
MNKNSHLTIILITVQESHTNFTRFQITISDLRPHNYNHKNTSQSYKFTSQSQIPDHKNSPLVISHHKNSPLISDHNLTKIDLRYSPGHLHPTAPPARRQFARRYAAACACSRVACARLPRCRLLRTQRTLPPPRARRRTLPACTATRPRAPARSARRLLRARVAARRPAHRRPAPPRARARSSPRVAGLHRRAPARRPLPVPCTPEKR